MTDITLQDLYDNNDGFDLFTFSTPQRMLYELTHESASNIWQYTARTAPYRLTDFENYDHNGDLNYALIFDGNNSAPAGTTLHLYCDGVTSMIQNWNYYDGVRNSVDLCFLIYESDKTYSASGNESVYVYKITSISNYSPSSDDTFNFIVPSLLTANRQYIIRLCCSTATTGMSDGACIYYNDGSLTGDWYAMPQITQAMFTVQGSGGGGSTDLFNYLTFEFNNGQYDFDDVNLILSNISFTNLISISSETNKTFNVSLRYYYENAASRVQLGYAYRTLNYYDVPYSNISIQYNNNIYVITSADLENKMAVKVEVTVSSNNVSQSKTFTAYVEKNN